MSSNNIEDKMNDKLNTYIALDVEATGISPNKSRIIEIGAIKVKDGVEVECEVLFTFESDETKKNYMVYTDNTTDENGNVRVYASIYNPDQPESDLIPIESEAEWKIIETQGSQYASGSRGRRLCNP